MDVHAAFLYLASVLRVGEVVGQWLHLNCGREGDALELRPYTGPTVLSSVDSTTSTENSA
jgi:hypothetical protein